MQQTGLFGQPIPLVDATPNFVPDGYKRELFLPNSRPYELLEPVRTLRVKNPLFMTYAALHRFSDIGISSEIEKNVDNLCSKARKQLDQGNYEEATKFIKEAEEVYMTICPLEMADLKVSHPKILLTRCLLENKANNDKICNNFGFIQRASVNQIKSDPNLLQKFKYKFFNDNWQEQLEKLFNQLLPLVEAKDNFLLEEVYTDRDTLCKRASNHQKLNVIGTYFEHIYSTVAIENVPTSLQEVEKCLANGFDSLLPSNFSSGSGSRAQIVGAAKGYYRILTECKYGGALTVELLHDLHRLLLSGVEDLAEHAGVFKKVDKECNEEHNNTQLYETPLKAFLDWYNRSAVAKINTGKIDPIVVATFVHGFFVALHPYKDGNGRLSRLLMNFVMIKAGFPPIRIPEKLQDQYYDANDDFFRGDPRTFYRFLCTCIKDTIKDLSVETDDPETDEVVSETVDEAVATSSTEACEQSRGLNAGSDKLSNKSKSFVSLESSVKSSAMEGVNSSLFGDVFFNDSQPQLLPKPSDYAWIDWPNIILEEIGKLGKSSTLSDDFEPQLLPKPSEYSDTDWPNIILEEIGKLGKSSTLSDEN
ncbi:fic/DOC family domain-containing protein [Ditylenchus destructor]|nr:fic/DOC family domain-containing protein [Ditylenchus destructor]